MLFPSALQIVKVFGAENKLRIPGSLNILATAQAPKTQMISLPVGRAGFD
jgi:hypothetical protein